MTYKSSKKTSKIIHFPNRSDQLTGSKGRIINNPSDLDPSMTVEELYETWSSEYFENINESTKRTIRIAWAYCGYAKNIRVKLLKSKHIKTCIDSCDSKSVKSKIRPLFNIMLDYAVEHKITDINCARDFITEAPEASSSHASFTDTELAILWNNDFDPFTDIILLQCYTGLRPQELLTLMRSDVDVDELTIKCGMKTTTGPDRIVPVCPQIEKVFIKLYWISVATKNKHYICRLDGSDMTYDKYYRNFMAKMAEYGMRHKPLDTRKTFMSMCQKNKVDEML